MKLIKTQDYNGPDRRGSNGNTNWLIFWLMTFAFGVVLVMFQNYGVSINDRISSANGELQVHSTILSSRGERISTLEANYSSIRLDLIEIKQDIKNLLKK